MHIHVVCKYNNNNNTLYIFNNPLMFQTENDVSEHVVTLLVNTSNILAKRLAVMHDVKGQKPSQKTYRLIKKSVSDTKHILVAIGDLFDVLSVEHLPEEHNDVELNYNSMWDACRAFRDRVNSVRRLEDSVIELKTCVEQMLLDKAKDDKDKYQLLLSAPHDTYSTNQ